MNFLQMHVLMGRISLQSIVNAKLSPEIKAPPLEEAFQDKMPLNLYESFKLASPNYELRIINFYPYP